MKKNEILELTIEGIRFPNVGLVQVLERVLEVKGALPGQRVRVRVVKKGKTNKGQVTQVLGAAPREVEPECPIFGRCGGCAFQNIPYDYELELKTGMIKDIFADFNIEEKFLPTVGSPVRRYRNKMEYSFGDDGEPDGALMLGMRKKGSFYEAVDASGCLLVHEDFGRILTATVEYFRERGESFFHRRKGTGTLRHLVIRFGAGRGELLVNLVTTSGNDYCGYAQMLLGVKLENSIVGILNTVSSSVADAIVPEQVKLLHGRDYYFEEFSEDAFGMVYKIPVFSFFQTNSVMAEVLYGVIREFAGDIQDKVIFDLYCGAGTIGKFLAAAGARRVVGVEIVEDAVVSAREDAPENCTFIAGDVKKIVKEIDEKPDIIILDPPREGIAPKAIPDILSFGAQKIIYVSCKPTSLAANLPAFLDGGYEVTKIKCVDMFPRTANVEVVMELSLQAH